GVAAKNELRDERERTRNDDGVPRAIPIAPARRVHFGVALLRRARERVRLVDEADHAQAVADADRRRQAAAPVVQRVAERGERDRLRGLPWGGLLALRGGEPEGPVLERQDGVAPGDLPLAVRPDSGERVADLDRPQHAARGA